MLKYEKLSKKAIGCMMVNEIMIALFFTVLCAVGWFVMGTIDDVIINRNTMWILAGVIWLISLAAPFIRYERYRYCFSEKEIEVKEGLIVVKRNIVPIERLHKVALESGPVDRIFGLSKVIVSTAGGDVTIRFMETKVAQTIVENLKTRINQYAIQKREGQ